MKNLKKVKGEDISIHPNIFAMLYGYPGLGKTTTLSQLPGKTLIIDVDKSSHVITNTAGLEVWVVEKLLVDTPEIMESLLTSCPYDNVCLDGVSEFEKTYLMEIAMTGKDGLIPEIQHYQKMQGTLIRVLKGLRTLNANIIITAWETHRDRIFPDGSKYSQAGPLMSDKTVDTVCGLCDLVGEMYIDKGERMIALEATMTRQAKDRIWKRSFCTTEEFLLPKKEDN